MSALGRTFNGVITDILDDPRDDTYRVLLERVVWSYKEGKWTSHKVLGWVGDADGSEVFNHPGNKAYGAVSHAEGRFTVAGEPGVESYGCHAEGWETVANGDASHAEGRGTHASGNTSHAEGNYTTASGDYSHAEGLKTVANGDASHAEGGDTTASGDYSHAEGIGTTASGDHSHAEGYNTTASGGYSHAEGGRTIAAGRLQHVQGQYNIEEASVDEYSNSKYAHIVGNGTDDTHRSNAHTLDWHGNAWFAGDIYIGGTG